eukprot:1899048-Ditylum_brightwellii.AAC.2
MISIVAMLNEFCSMLLGTNTHFFTDHKNLTFGSIKTQRVLCLINQIEEFSVLHYIEGPKDILADNLPRLKRLITLVQLAKGKNLVDPACVNDEEDDNAAFFFEQACSGVYDEDIQTSLECYLNLPDNENLSKIF